MIFKRPANIKLSFVKAFYENKPIRNNR